MDETYDAVLILPRENNIVYKNSYRESAKTVKNIMRIARQDNYEVYREPLGIESIAAYLRKKGLRVKLFFCDLENIEDSYISDFIYEKRVPFIGLSVLFDRHLEHAVRLSNIIDNTMTMRNLKSNIFIGGPLASFAADDIVSSFPWISGVLVGEGEYVDYNVIQCILNEMDWKLVKGVCYLNEDGTVTKTEREDKVCLDELPYLDRDFLIRAKELGHNIKTSSLYTSRGCAQACTYCTGNQLPKFNKGKTWRYRKPIDIVNEIENLVSTFGITYLYICDDNFFGYGKNAETRIFNIIDLLQERRIKIRFHFEMRVNMISDELLKKCKEGGFVDIFLGIESGVQSMLDRWHKGSTVEQNFNAINMVRNYGLNIHPGFILFDEFTTFDELIENLKFILLSKINTADLIFSLFNPMQIFVGSTMQLSGDYRVGNEKYDNSFDYIKKTVDKIVRFEYELKDHRVYIFWESVKQIIDETNYYFNYYIIPEIYSSKESFNKNELLCYLKKFKLMKKELGNILMEICMYSVELIRINNSISIEQLKNIVIAKYKEINKKFFNMGVYEDFVILKETRGNK